MKNEMETNMKNELEVKFFHLREDLKTYPSLLEGCIRNLCNLTIHSARLTFDSNYKPQELPWMPKAEIYNRADQVVAAMRATLDYGGAESFTTVGIASPYCHFFDLTFEESKMITSSDNVPFDPVLGYSIIKKILSKAIQFSLEQNGIPDRVFKDAYALYLEYKNIDKTGPSFDHVEYNNNIKLLSELCEKGWKLGILTC